MIFSTINDFVMAKNKKNNEIKENNEVKDNNEKIDNNKTTNNKENKKKSDVNENNNKIYIIIGQFQDIHNMSYLFDLFKNIKIILLS